VDALARGEAADTERRLSWLLTALDTLSVDLRATAALTLGEQMNFAEAAEALGVAEGTVAWRMSEIRRRLKTLAAGGAGMNDDTDKLAAQMKNLKPSKTSRKAGLEAAMAAFNTEFAVETGTDVEKNTASPQGSGDAPRPTGKPTTSVRVKTRRVETMRKFTAIFQKPQAMMMAGTCGAALIAALVVLPNMEELRFEEKLSGSVPVAAEVAPIDASSEDTASESDVIVMEGTPVSGPEAGGGANTETQIIEVERRVVKTPAVTVERTVPSISKTETRRVQKSDGTFENVTEVVAVQEAATELVTIPPTYETVRDTVEVAADGTRTVVSSEAVPQAPHGGITSVDSLLSSIRRDASKVEAENRQRVQHFKQTATRPGSIAASQERTQIILPGSNDLSVSTQYPEKFGNLTVEVVPSEADTTINETGEILARTLVPAEYKTIEKQVLVSPARSEEVIIPAVTKDVIVKKANGDGTFREVIEQVVIQEERVDYVVTPPVYETRTERVLVGPARQEWKPNSQTIKTVSVSASPKIYLRDDDGNVVREFENRDAFEAYKANLPTAVSEKPVSTFSIDVDTASYSFLRASINRGQLPPRESIRLEEMINYFPYDYQAPKTADKPKERPNSNIVLLIDTSGSMNQANKLPLLINSFKLLLKTLNEDDTVSIVTYAGRAGEARDGHFPLCAWLWHGQL